MVRVLVVGTGSIGRRHIANLLKLGADVSAFSYRGAGHQAFDPLPSEVTLVDGLRDAVGTRYDAVVVANRTDLHMQVAIDAARNGSALFIEKPIAASMAGVDELVEVIVEKRLVVEVGFMLRSHPNLRWIKSFMVDGALGELHYARAAVGQFLPLWRPGTDHRLGYGARRESGGGVILDLIHDLDAIAWLAGEVEEVMAMTRAVPSLEIETEAVAQIGLRLRSGVLAQVHLDYVRLDYERSLELVGSKGLLRWDYLSGSVVLGRGDGKYQVVHRVPEKFERNNMYMDHMKHFLTRLGTDQLDPIASIRDGAAALRVALASHRSAEERRAISPREIDTGYRIGEGRR